MLSRFAGEFSQATMSSPCHEGSRESRSYLRTSCKTRPGQYSPFFLRQTSSFTELFPLWVNSKFDFLSNFLSPALRPSLRGTQNGTEASLPLATAMAAVRCTSDADGRWPSPFSWWKVQSTRQCGRSTHEVARDACRVVGYAPPKSTVAA